MIGSLQAGPLLRAYRAGALSPRDVVEEVYARIAARGDDGIWIHVRDRDEAVAEAIDVARRFAGSALPPLFGLPFAVKDNIDVEGMPTTAACPEFAYQPTASAPIVTRLREAGAIVIGKTNLDQFATGLSGLRSPYGLVRNPHDPSMIAGGSSSGSAAAVAAGLVTFALGTDTAGSGRVPAGLTGTVGVKPSRGLVSTRGIVPACRSLDCASIVALSAVDGSAVLAQIAGTDPLDPYSRALVVPPSVPQRVDLREVRVGIPSALEPVVDFGGDHVAAALFDRAVGRLERMGAQVVPVEIEPFVEVGTWLYDGPWIAERVAGLESFLDQHPDALHPVVGSVLARGRDVTGVEAYRGEHALARARREVAPTWAAIDVLMLPTVPTAPSVERVLADPIGANSALGRYTNFVNLLDLAGVAVPSEETPRGLPVGVTFLGPAGADGLLLGVAAAWQAEVQRPVDVQGHQLDAGGPDASAPWVEPRVELPRDPVGPAPEGALLAVVGAHLRGGPLHEDLLDLGATLHAEVATAAEYRLYALAPEPGLPARPGLVRVGPGESGYAILAEVYRIPVAGLGRFMTGVRAPLGIGTVRLADGSEVLGFLCEEAGLTGASDISAHGGWRAYLASLVPA